MPYRFNIATIDEDENPYTPDSSDFDDEYCEVEKGEQDYLDAKNICDWCNGINYNCHYCGGTGTIKRKY